MQYLLYAKHYSKHFTDINSFHPQKNFQVSIIKDRDFHNKNFIITFL